MGPAVLLSLAVTLTGNVATAAGLGRPELVDFAVVSDACGGWTATVQATGTGQRLRVSTNGDVTAEWTINGLETVTVDGQAHPGDRLTLEARIGHRRAVRRTIHLAPFAAKMTVTPLEAVVTEGREGRFDIHVTSLCDASKLRWDAAIRQTGATRTGPVLANGDAWFVLPSLQHGVYDVDVALHAPDGSLVRQSVVYRVEPAP